MFASKNVLLQGLYEVMGDTVTRIVVSRPKVGRTARTMIEIHLSCVVSSKPGFYLSTYHVEEMIDRIGAEVMTPRGKFITRLVREVKLQTGLKLSPEEVSQLGNILSVHNSQDKTYHCDVTHEYDWEDGQFGHEGSCYWKDAHVASRDTLHENDTLCLRLYRDEYDTEGKGRIWLSRVPNDPHAIVLFNAYGWSFTDGIAVITDALKPLGLSSVHVELINQGDTRHYNRDDPYINNDSGWCIFDPQNTSYSEGCTVDIDMPVVNDGEYALGMYAGQCYSCDRLIEDEDDIFTSPSGDTLCERCYRQQYQDCCACGHTFDRDSLYEVSDWEFTYLCENCYTHHGFHECCSCGRARRGDDIVHVDENNPFCQRCYDRYFSPCDICGKMVHRGNGYHVEGIAPWVCEACYQEHGIRHCVGCGRHHFPYGLTVSHEGTDLCPSCVERCTITCVDCHTIYLRSSERCPECGTRYVERLVMLGDFVTIEGSDLE